MPKKSKTLYSYKLYTIGEDLEQKRTLLAHYVYGAPNVTAAKKIAAKDEHYIRILRKYRLSPKTVQYVAIFRTDETGAVLDAEKEAAFRSTFVEGQ